MPEDPNIINFRHFLTEAVIEMNNELEDVLKEDLTSAQRAGVKHLLLQGRLIREALRTNPNKN